MGRNSKGATITGEAQKLEINTLIKKGYFKNGCCIHNGRISWTNGSSIGYDAELTEQKQEIRLFYWNQNNAGEKTDLDYKIQLTSIPSNLGRGGIWYFVCPFTGRKAKILYKCYGSPYFKSRKAYQNRIYYSSQISSKLEFYNNRYWEIEHKLEKLYPIIRKEHYQGKETRLKKRIRILEVKKEYLDFKRWITMPKSISKMLKSDFPNL